MHSLATRLLTLVTLASFVSLACYNRYDISTDELSRLQSRFIGETTTVTSGEREVAASATTPIRVRTQDGARYNVSPFNFVLTETQLVAPDYDLLLPREQIVGADVSEFNATKTALLISGVVGAAAAGFILLTVLAD